MTNITVANKLVASHLCDSGPCINKNHIVLETKERKALRKKHQNGTDPCDCKIPCLRNGVFWYKGEKPGVMAAPYHRYPIMVQETEFDLKDKEEKLDRERTR